MGPNYNTPFVQHPKVRRCRGADGFRLRLSEQVGFEVFLKVGRVRQARMSEGSEFQVVAAATEKARRARSVLVLGATMQQRGVG